MFEGAETDIFYNL